MWSGGQFSSSVIDVLPGEVAPFSYSHVEVNGKVRTAQFHTCEICSYNSKIGRHLITTGISKTVAGITNIPVDFLMHCP